MNIQKIALDLKRYETQIIRNLSSKDWQHFKLYFFIREKFLKNDIDDQFKRVFCNFYVMNGARGLNDSQKEKFFKLLMLRENNLANILKELHAILGYGEKQKLFISFGTKLLHTINETLPIYDTNVASVLELPSQIQTDSLEEKIKNRITIYEKLKEDSKELSENREIRNHLTHIRKELRDKAEREDFSWQDEFVSGEKLLDSVLWALYAVRGKSHAETGMGSLPNRH